MIWDILETKILNANLGVTDGSLFRGQMPFSCSQGVLLRFPLDGIRNNPYAPGYYRTVLQVIVRHADPVDGQAMADAVGAALTITGEERYAASDERGPAMLKEFYLRELPIQYPRLEGNTYEWSLNFVAAFTLSAS